MKRRIQAMLHLQILYQISLLVFQTTEASRVHVYTHLAVCFFSWNVNIKLIALGPATVVLFQSCFVLFYLKVTQSFFTDICQHFLTAKLIKTVYFLFITRAGRLRVLKWAPFVFLLLLLLLLLLLPIFGVDFRSYAVWFARSNFLNFLIFFTHYLMADSIVGLVCFQ